LAVRRKQPSEFPKHTFDLLQTFAVASEPGKGSAFTVRLPVDADTH
jgi:hypothetical protein